MSYLVIEGGKKLQGEIAVQANKNSALSIIIAALAIKGESTIVDVPNIEEVRRLIELLRSIGARIDDSKPHVLKIDASQDLNISAIDRKLCEKLRVSLLLTGALAAREKSYKLYKSGGCNLGERTVRPLWYALAKLGVEVTSEKDGYRVKTLNLKANKVVMYESGDVATENVIMAAVLTPGVTEIKMASANYMVQDLCFFLKKAGAKIEGIGSTTLKITGIAKLKSVKNYPIMPDPIVAMTWISIAITTHSHLVIRNCPLEFLELELEKLSVMGQKYEITNLRKSKNGLFEVGDITIIPSVLQALSDKIYGRPFPGLNIDNLPLFVPILTQAKGRTLVHDWAYDNRAIYSLELQKLGAQITLLDPHRVWVEGPTKFTAAELMCPPALRPGVNVLICMLAASGKSILRNTYMIERGYEDFYENLNKLGARIQVFKE